MSKNKPASLETQVNKLMDLFFLFPLLGIGLACVAFGNATTGGIVILCHFILNRVNTADWSSTSEDRKDNNND